MQPQSVFIIMILIAVILAAGCSSVSPQAISDHKYQWGDIVFDNQSGDMIVIINAGNEPGKYLISGVTKGEGVGNYYRVGSGSDHVSFTDIESRYKIKMGWIDPLKLENLPTSVTTTIPSPSSTTQSGSQGKYSVGDIISDEIGVRKTSDGSSIIGICITNINPIKQEYTWDVCIRDIGKTSWYRFYPDPQTESFYVVEHDNPYKIGFVNPDTVTSMYPSEEALNQALGSSSTSSYSSRTNGQSSKTLHFSGTGDDLVSFSVTGQGMGIFTSNYRGEHNFIVELKDSNGEYVDLIANEIGSYSGRSSTRLTSGKYYLEVKSSGPWTIDLELV